MKVKLALIAAFVAVLGLAACGGGASSNGIAVSSPAALTKTDTVLGTGAQAASGRKVTINYTGWLYSDSAADHKGAKFQASTFTFTIGGDADGNGAIAGVDQGVVGMKVGGKRTLLIPASLGYGSAGSGAIPPNSGLVFEIELTKVE